MPYFAKLGFLFLQILVQSLLSIVFTTFLTIIKIFKSLSSFSSEVNNYIELREIKKNRLILFLLMKFSTRLVRRGFSSLTLLGEIKKLPNTIVIISTHHQLLKTFIHDNSDYISSHVGFDFNNNTSNYKLQIGTPGALFTNLKIFLENG